MGPTCSPRAVQEQIKKLRKDARAGFDETNQTFPGAQATPDKSASRKAPRAIAPAKLNSNAMQNKAATANNEPVNAKPKANEEDSCKVSFYLVSGVIGGNLDIDDVQKRKYNSPGALDVHTSFTTGNTMADVLYAAGVAYEEAA